LLLLHRGRLLADALLQRLQVSDAIEDEVMKFPDVEPFTFLFLKFGTNLLKLSLAYLVGRGLTGSRDVTIDLYVNEENTISNKGSSPKKVFLFVWKTT
jgi:hypothetical protein